MRLISTKTLRSGMRLGNTIYNVTERPLLQKDVVLTEKMVQRLRELNVQYVYIDDERSKGIEMVESVPVEIRQHAIREIRGTFEDMKEINTKTLPVLLDKKTNQIQQVLKDVMREMQESTDLLTILSDAYLYDSYIFHHSFNVTLYSLAIGKQLRLPQRQLEQLGMGAILHDIGKMMIPEEVLLKPGPLTEEEFLMIREHPSIGFEILRNLNAVSLLVAHCAFQHHERLDGSGYPRGIMKTDIHPFAKIIAVADVFDACTSNRIYRTKMLPSEGLDILYAGAGTLYDPTVIKAFTQAIAIYPNGLVVELNDGRRGIIAKQNAGFSTRPIIRILQNGDDRIDQPYEVNLLEVLDLVITKTDVSLLVE